MTTEERLSKLEKELQDIRLENDVVHSESLKKRVLQSVIFAGVTSTSLTDINETTSVPAGGGSVTHAEAFDKKIKITIDGTDYWLGLFNYP